SAGGEEHDGVVLAAPRDAVGEDGLAEDDRLDVGDLQCPPRSISRIVDYTPDCLQSEPVSDGSPVHCTIDLDGPGTQVGRLEVPRSTNTSGWSHQFVPIVSIRGGNGPTAVVFGGVHGDEPEGQVAALRLARETEPGDLLGRV